MSEETEPTCVREQYINIKASKNIGFSQDLNIARVQVASGRHTVDSALDFLKREEGGSLAPTVGTELRNCFENIIAGECPVHPVVEN